MFPVITITGRRVSIDRMFGEHERLIFAGTKSLSAGLEVSKKLINALVKPHLNYDDLTISEETDLYYLIRLMSRKNITTFRWKCPNKTCGKQDDYMVDIRGMRRSVILCGDEECPCHSDEIQKYDLDELCSSEDPRATADFESVPENHLKDTPPSYAFTLEETGVPVRFELLRAKWKNQVGQWAQSEDDRILIKSLARSIVTIDHLEFGGSGDRTKFFKEVEEYLARKVTSFDLYLLRDKINDADGGVDNTVKVTCKYCSEEYRPTLPLDASFFLLRRAHSTA